MDFGAAIRLASTIVPPCIIRPALSRRLLTSSNTFLAKLVCFKHMSELKQGSRIRYLLFMEIYMHKGTHSVTVVDRILDSFIGQIKPYLHEIHAKHGFNTNRFATTLVSEIIRAINFLPSMTMG